jgi:hypothetical protein
MIVVGGQDQDGRAMTNGATICMTTVRTAWGPVAALAVRELTWGFLTHSAFDLGRPITLAPVGSQWTPGLPPEI